MEVVSRFVALCWLHMGQCPMFLLRLVCLFEDLFVWFDCLFDGLCICRCGSVSCDVAMNSLKASLELFFLVYVFVWVLVCLFVCLVCSLCLFWFALVVYVFPMFLVLICFRLLFVGCGILRVAA